MDELESEMNPSRVSARASLDELLVQSGRQYEPLIVLLLVQQCTKRDRSLACDLAALGVNHLNVHFLVDRRHSSRLMAEIPRRVAICEAQVGLKRVGAALVL